MTKCPSLPKVVLVCACGLSIIINSIRFLFQKCSDLGMKLDGYSINFMRQYSAITMEVGSCNNCTLDRILNNEVFCQILSAHILNPRNVPSMNLYYRNPHAMSRITHTHKNA